jgi:hypothetical protein
MKPKAIEGFEDYEFHDRVALVTDDENGIFIVETEVAEADISSSQGVEVANYHRQVSVTDSELQLRLDYKDREAFLAGNQKIFAKYVAVDTKHPGRFKINGEFTIGGFGFSGKEVTEYSPHHP